MCELSILFGGSKVICGIIVRKEGEPGDEAGHSQDVYCYIQQNVNITCTCMTITFLELYVGTTADLHP